MSHIFARNIVYILLAIALYIVVYYSIFGTTNPFRVGASICAIIAFLHMVQYEKIQKMSEDEIASIGLFDKIGIEITLVFSALMFVAILVISLIDTSPLDSLILNSIDLLLFIPMAILFGTIVPRYLFKHGYLKTEDRQSSIQNEPEEPLSEPFEAMTKDDTMNPDN